MALLQFHEHKAATKLKGKSGQHDRSHSPNTAAPNVAAAPVGTPLFAMTSGTITVAIGDAGIYTPGGPGRCGNTVVLSGSDQATYTYCHLDAVLVAPGQSVAAGTRVGTTGGQPGTPGAGNTTGPHLHFAVRVYGQSVCPQPLLLAIGRGRPLPPPAAPTHGCTTPGANTDWPVWLDQLEAEIAPGERPQR